MSDDKPNPYEELYNKAKWRTLGKYLDEAKRSNLDEKEAKDYFDERVIHDKRTPKAKFIPIVSKHPNGYQMDTFINDKRAGGLNYLVFININTRKAHVYPMQGKGAKEVLRALHQFVQEVPNVYSITSDEDVSYLSNNVLDYLHDHNIVYKTTTENNHNVLGIINRFMRTIRDAIGENRYIEEKEMQDLVNIYNNSPHRSLSNKAPNDITKDDEIKYIKEKSRINPYHFQEGEHVRLVLDKDPFSKRRTNVSTESYVIDSKKGNQFLIRSKDGSTSSYPGYRLIKTADPKIKQAKTLNEGKEGVIEKIDSYDTKTGKYHVKYENSSVEEDLPIRNVRRGNPLVLGPREQEFWLEQKKRIERQAREVKAKKIKGKIKQEDKKIPNQILKYV